MLLEQLFDDKSQYHTNYSIFTNYHFNREVTGHEKEMNSEHPVIWIGDAGYSPVDENHAMKGYEFCYSIL